MIDYTYYSETYGGDVVSAASFNKALTRAESILDRMSFSSIKKEGDEYGQILRDGTFQPFTDRELLSLKYAMCALVDTIGKLDAAETRAIAGNGSDENIASRSSGGESISYRQIQTAYDVAINDENAKRGLYVDAVRSYVNPTAFRINPFYAGWR